MTNQPEPPKGFVIVTDPQHKVKRTDMVLWRGVYGGDHWESCEDKDELIGLSWGKLIIIATPTVPQPPLPKSIGGIIIPDKAPGPWKGGDETCQSTGQPHQVRATGSQAPEVTKGAASPVRIDATTGKPLPTPDECTTMDDLRSLHIHALAKLVHIIVGDGGRCMCGMYDDVAMDCPHILAMHDEGIASGLVELIPQTPPAMPRPSGVIGALLQRAAGPSPQQPPPAESEPTQQQIEKAVALFEEAQRRSRAQSSAKPSYFHAMAHLRELSRATDGLRKELDESRAECEGLTHKNIELDTALSTCEDRIKELHEEVHAIRAENERLRTALKKVKLSVLTMTPRETPRELLHICRLCIDAGITEHLEELQLQALQPSAKEHGEDEP